MAIDPSDRASYFPIIEKRYGQPMKYWHEVMKNLKEYKYPEAIAYLKENYGFSQAHANALVMYSRGSKSSKRFDTVDEFLKKESPEKKKLVKAIFKSIQDKYPKTELVIAWNKPMLKFQDQYIFGVALATNHILLAPFDPKILKKLEPKLKEYKVLKKTVQVPLDWKIDEKLLQSMVKLAIDQIK